MNSGYTRNLLAVAILASISAPALSAEERGDCDVPITLGSKPTMDDFSGDYAAFLVAALDHKKKKDAQDEQKKTCPEFYRETPIDFDDDENLLEAVQSADDQPEFDYENNKTWQGKTTSESFPLDDAESEALSDTQINTPLENLLIADQQNQTSEGNESASGGTNSGTASSVTSSSAPDSTGSNTFESSSSDSNSGGTTFSQSAQTGSNGFADSGSNSGQPAGQQGDAFSAQNGSSSTSSASDNSAASTGGALTNGLAFGDNDNNGSSSSDTTGTNQFSSGSAGAVSGSSSTSSDSGASGISSSATGSSTIAGASGGTSSSSGSTTFVASSSANAISQGGWQTSIADILGSTNNPNSIYNLYNADNSNPSSDPNDPVQAVLSGEATVDQNGELVFQSGFTTTPSSQQQQQALLLSAFGGQLEDGSQTVSDQLLLSQNQSLFNEQQTAAAYTAGNLDPVSNLVVYNIVTPQGLNNTLTLQLTPEGNIAGTSANVEYESCWSSCGEFEMIVRGSP